jgi:hypothetical protein
LIISRITGADLVTATTTEAWMTSSYWTILPVKVNVDSDNVKHLASVDFEFPNPDDKLNFGSKDLARDWLAFAHHLVEET